MGRVSAGLSGDIFTIEHFITDNYWATQTVLDTYIPLLPVVHPLCVVEPLLVVLGIYLI